MQLICCTKKLQKEMGIGAKDMVASESESSGLGPWHANLIYVDRRKSVLFTNDATLFNFLVPDIPRSLIRDPGRLFRDNLQCVLAEEGFSEAQVEKVLEQYQDIAFSGSRSRSVLGSMNEIAFCYKYAMMMSGGGIYGCDFPGIIKNQNRMLMGAPDYRYPIEALRTLCLSVE
ncbi:MAG: DUF6933 domain-containing protein [Thermoleophilia bacterium]